MAGKIINMSKVKQIIRLKENGVVHQHFQSFWEESLRDSESFD